MAESDFMHLIVQGADPETRHLKELAQLTGASAIEQITRTAFRLCDAEDRRADVAAYCEARQLDFGYVPGGVKLSHMGLFVTDMDSTMITIECIDEIADMQGLKPQVAAITESAMRGEIDFAESLRRRVSLLAGLDQSALGRVYEERLRLSPGVDKLLPQLKAAGLTTVLVSGGFTFFTERLKAKLGFDHAYANTLEVADGKLTGRVLGDIVDGEAKRRFLVQHREALGLSRDAVIAAGDGANDLRMLGEATYSIAYRAKPVVRAQAAYAINHCGLDAILNLFER